MRKDGKYTKLLGHAGSLKAIACFIKTAMWIRMEKYIILNVCMCKGEKKNTLHSSLSKDIVTLILTPNNFSWRLQLHYKAEVEKQIRFLFMMALPLHLKRPQRNHEKGIWTAHSFSSEAIFNLKKNQNTVCSFISLIKESCLLGQWAFLTQIHLYCCVITPLFSCN